MKTNDNIRSRNFAFVTYANPATLIDLFPNIIHCCAILHDKDFKDDSKERVTPHYHMIIMFKHQHFYSGVRKVIDSFNLQNSSNTFVEPVHSLSSMLLYILHQDTKSLADINKFSYSFDNLISDNPSYWRKIYDGNDDIANMEFVQDLLVESPIKMAYKYGRDFIKNFDRYINFREKIYGLYGSDYCFLTDDAQFDGASNILGFKSYITQNYILKEN